MGTDTGAEVRPLATAAAPQGAAAASNGAAPAPAPLHPKPTLGAERPHQQRRRTRRGQGQVQAHGVGVVRPGGGGGGLEGCGSIMAAVAAGLQLQQAPVGGSAAGWGVTRACRPFNGRQAAREQHQQEVQVAKMIREFKTQPCVREGATSSHDHRCCPFYHSERDRRRIVVGPGVGAQPRYAAKPCDAQFDDKRTCPRGEVCGFCHSTAELLYHPEFFRKRLCHQAKRCPRGKLCAFAHTRQELLVPHFTEEEEMEPTEEFIAHHFKTQWCPIGGPHDWENCVYAHTYRDWRRTPILGYSSWPCPQWAKSLSAGPSELLYEDRCPYGMACPLAHGAKEQLYHPQFYKTSPCSEETCKRGPLCAFTHGTYDTRWPRASQPPAQTPQGPIPWVEEILERYQPTYWNPPRYHALEDPSRDLSGLGAVGPAVRGLLQRRLVSGTDTGDFGPLDPDYTALPLGLPPQAERCVLGAPAFVPYCYRWVPFTETGHPALPLPMGYGEVSDSWPISFAAAPLLNQAAWGPGMAPACWLEGSTLLLPDAVRSTDCLASEHPDEGYEPNSEPHNYGAVFDCGYEPNSEPHNYGAPRVERISRKMQQKYFRSGLRTPSSLGSPGASVTPTEVPSPRQAESTGTSDDTTAKEPAVELAILGTQPVGQAPAAVREDARPRPAVPCGGPRTTLGPPLAGPRGRQGTQRCWLPPGGGVGTEPATARSGWAGRGQHSQQPARPAAAGHAARDHGQAA